eukprot:403351775
MSFKDDISRAELTNPTNKQSKMARLLLLVDLVQISKLNLLFENKLNTLEHLVQFFCYREHLITDNQNEDVLDIDDKVCEAFEQDEEAIDQFWSNLRSLIIERVTRSIKFQRPQISEIKLREWILQPEGEYNLFEILDASCKRIENIEELKTYATQQILKIERTFGDKSISQIISSDNIVHGNDQRNLLSQQSIMQIQPDQNTLYDKIQLVLSSSTTWLHKEQLLSDYILYSIMLDMCQDEEQSIAFDKESFINQFKNEKSNNSMLDSLQNQDPTSVLRKNFRFKILLEFAIYLKQEKDLNQTDLAKRSALTFISLTGNKKMLKFLLRDPLLFLNEKNLANQTALELAVENTDLTDEENVVIKLLQRGAAINKDLFNKLLNLALNKDLVTYFRIAFQRDYNLHKPLDAEKPSLHKAVGMNSYKILQFFSTIFSQNELKIMINEPDFQGMTCLDYSDIANDIQIKQIIKSMLEGEAVILDYDQQQPLNLMHENDVKNKLFSANLNQNLLLSTINELRKQIQDLQLKSMKQDQSQLQEKDQQIEILKLQIQNQNEMMYKIHNQLDEIQKGQRFINSQHNYANSQNYQLQQRQASQTFIINPQSSNKVFSDFMDQEETDEDLDHSRQQIIQDQGEEILQQQYQQIVQHLEKSNNKLDKMQAQQKKVQKDMRKLKIEHVKSSQKTINSIQLQNWTIRDQLKNQQIKDVHVRQPEEMSNSASRQQQQSKAHSNVQKSKNCHIY